MAQEGATKKALRKLSNKKNRAEPDSYAIVFAC
jgi:hypothetical protein